MASSEEQRAAPEPLSRLAAVMILAPAVLFWALLFTPLEWIDSPPEGRGGAYVEWSRDVSAMLVGPLLQGLCFFSVLAGLTAMAKRARTTVSLVAWSPLVFVAWRYLG